MAVRNTRPVDTPVRRELKKLTADTKKPPLPIPPHISQPQPSPEFAETLAATERWHNLSPRERAGIIGEQEFQGWQREQRFDLAALPSAEQPPFLGGARVDPRMTGLQSIPYIAGDYEDVRGQDDKDARQKALVDMVLEASRVRSEQLERGTSEREIQVATDSPYAGVTDKDKILPFYAALPQDPVGDIARRATRAGIAVGSELYQELVAPFGKLLKPGGLFLDALDITNTTILQLAAIAGAASLEANLLPPQAAITAEAVRTLPASRHIAGEISTTEYIKLTKELFDSLPLGGQVAAAFVNPLEVLTPLGPLDTALSVTLRTLAKAGIKTIRGVKLGAGRVIDQASLELQAFNDIVGAPIEGLQKKIRGNPGAAGAPKIDIDDVVRGNRAYTKHLIEELIIAGDYDGASKMAREVGERVDPGKAITESVVTEEPISPLVSGAAGDVPPKRPLGPSEQPFPGGLGPEGPGQFVRLPGDEASRAAYELWSAGLSKQPVPKVALPKRIISGAQELQIVVKEMMTDVFTRSRDLQRRVEKYWLDTYNERLPMELQVGLHMALGRGGTHNRAFLRYRRTMDKVASILDGTNADWVNKYMTARHQLDVLIMHPRRATPAIYEGDELIKPAHDVGTVRGHLSELQTEMNFVGGPGTYEKVSAAAVEVRNLYKSMLTEKVQAGLFDYDLSQRLANDYPWYNPLRYHDNQNFEIYNTAADLKRGIQQGRNEVVGNTTNSLHSLADNGADIFNQQDSPLNVMLQSIMSHEHLISVNRAAQSMVKALFFDQSTTLLVKRRADLLVEIGEEGFGKVTRILDEDVSAVVERDWRKVRKIYSNVVRRTEGTSVIQVWEGGKPVMYEVPEWAAENLKHLVNFDQSTIERVGRFLNSPARAAFTSYNPAFMAANFVHEMWLLAFVHGIMPHKALISLAASMKNIFKEDRLIAELTENYGLVLGLTGDLGTRQGGMGREGAQRARLGFERLARKEAPGLFDPKGTIVLRNSRDWHRFKNPKGIVKGLNDVAQAFEVSTRRAIYADALSKGSTPAEAALKAREGMVDFARWGHAIHLADSAFLYLNAGVQGFMMPINALRNSGKARAGAAGLAGVATGLYAWNRRFTDPENNYFDIPFRERRGGLVVMLPWGKGERQADGTYKPHYINILPFARELSLLTGSITHVLETIDGRTKGNFGTWFDGVIEQSNPFSSVLPFRGRSSFPALNYVPYPTQPGELVSELATNWDNFRNKPIVDPTTAKLPEGERANSDTSLTARTIGKITGIAPPKIDHMIQFGGMTRDIVAGMDYVFRKFDVNRPPQEVSNVVDELLMIADTYPDDLIDREQRRYRNSLDPKVVTPKEIDDEYRRQVRGDRTPFIGSILDRFANGGGYERHRYAKDEAITEAGASVEQTRRVNEEMAIARRQAHEAQWASDRAWENNEIDPRQWRKESGINSQITWVAMINAGGKFPDAVQVKNGRFGYHEYIEMIVTMNNRWTDERSRSELLYSAWLGLEHYVYRDQEIGDQPSSILLEESTESWLESMHQNPTPLFKVQEEFWDALSQEERIMLIEERTSRATPLRAQYIEDMVIMGPYFRIDTNVLEGLEGKSRSVYSDYLDGNTSQRQALMNRYSGRLRAILNRVARRKRAFRRSDKEEGFVIDTLLNKYGFVTVGITPPGRAAAAERIEGAAQGAAQPEAREPVGAGTR